MCYCVFGKYILVLNVRFIGIIGEWFYLVVVGRSVRRRDRVVLLTRVGV